MTAIGEMIAYDERVRIAKNAVKEGANTNFIVKITGLDEETVKKLQAEYKDK